MSIEHVVVRNIHMNIISSAVNFEAASPIYPLKQARNIEIENAFYFPEILNVEWLRRARRNGFRPGNNIANSAYVDTRGLDFFASYNTLRARKGAPVMLVDVTTGQKYVGKRYPNQFALKRRHALYQATATQIARRLRPGFEGTGVEPYVREEIEGRYNWPVNATELRFGDFPHTRWEGQLLSVGEVLESLIDLGKINGVTEPKDLVAPPLATTYVRRQPMSLYWDPTRKMDFLQNWPSMAPTAEMVDSGNYICIEAAIDKCIQRVPPAGMPIEAILGAQKDAFRAFRRIGTDNLFEYEIKPEECGPNLSDEGMVCGHMDFGIALLEFTDAMKNRTSFSNVGYAVRPAASKGVNAIGAWARLQGGAIYQRYMEAAPYVA
jgi:hypothetical protein